MCEAFTYVFTFFVVLTISVSLLARLFPWFCYHMIFFFFSFYRFLLNFSIFSSLNWVYGSFFSSSFLILLPYESFFSLHKLTVPSSVGHRACMQLVWECLASPNNHFVCGPPFTLHFSPGLLVSLVVKILAFDFVAAHPLLRI